MAEMIVGICVCGSLCFHAASLLLLRREIKAISDRYPPETPSYVEKKELKRRPRRATRLTDASKKWLATKGKQEKEVI